MIADVAHWYGEVASTAKRLRHTNYGLNRVFRAEGWKTNQQPKLVEPSKAVGSPQPKREPAAKNVCAVCEAYHGKTCFNAAGPMNQE
jgi:hypothetical protein